MKKGKTTVIKGDKITLLAGPRCKSVTRKAQQIGKKTKVKVTMRSIGTSDVKMARGREDF